MMPAMIGLGPRRTVVSQVWEDSPMVEWAGAGRAGVGTAVTLLTLVLAHAAQGEVGVVLGSAE